MSKKLFISLWLLLVLFYFTTRLINLKSIPIFTDEAIYTRWAQIALHDPAQRFISLNDGKQPLFIWLAAISMKFINDPLVATRLVSIFAGLGSLIGIYLLAAELFNKKVAFISSIFYLVVPFTLLYDRLGLYDSLLTMIGIYSVLMTVKLAKLPNLGNSFMVGITIGLGLITKSSALFFLYLLPLSAIVSPIAKVKQKDGQKKLLKWLFFILLSAIIAQLMYNSLRLSSLFYIIAGKNLEFIRPINEVLKDPLRFFPANLIALISWLSTYMGLPLFMSALLGIVFGIIKRNLNIIFILFYVITPLSAEIIFNKVLYPRFALFYFPYVLLLAAYFFSEISKTISKPRYLIAIVSIVLLIPVSTSATLLFNPQSAKIPLSDSNQYLNGWPAGFGVNEVIDILNRESQNQKIFIGTEGTFGLFPYALEIYSQKNKNIEIQGFWPVDPDSLPQAATAKALKQQSYFVFNENQSQINNPKLKLIGSFQKGKSQGFMRIYRLFP